MIGRTGRNGSGQSEKKTNQPPAHHGMGKDAKESKGGLESQNYLLGEDGGLQD